MTGHQDRPLGAKTGRASDGAAAERRTATGLTVVGAFARIARADRTAVIARLSALPGVSTFELSEREKIGLVIEAGDLDEAHALMTRDVRAVEGVLGVWPVSAEWDEGEMPPGNPGPS